MRQGDVASASCRSHLLLFRPGCPKYLRVTTSTAPTAGATSTVLPVEAEGLSLTFHSTDTTVVAVDDVSLSVGRGQIAVIVGPSGSGKSSLLQLLAGLDTPDRGSVRIGGTELTTLRDRALTALRRTRIGFVFQAFHLLPTMTARQNIVLPMRLAGTPVNEHDVDDLARMLGISNRLDHLPGQLSGGQQQRVAIARALLPQPEVIFADEPTGALDAESGGELLDMIRWAARERGQTFVIVTHDEKVAAMADLQFRMDSGVLRRER